MARKKKLENSVYWATLVKCVNSGMEPPDVYKFLTEEKGYKVNIMAVRRAVDKVKREGANALLLEDEAKKAIIQMDKNIEEAVPNMTSLIGRRTHLLKNILERKQMLIDSQNEKSRTAELKKMVEAFSFCKNDEERKVLQNKVLKFIDANFQNCLINTSVESLIRQYTMDTHEIFKYVEQFLDKYDVCDMVENMSIKVAKAAIDVFSKYIVKETEEERARIINSFKSKVNQCLEDIKEKNLGIVDEVIKKENNK